MKCNHKTKKYSDLFDAFYCTKCFSWLEKKCKDPNCQYCTKRPEKQK